MNLVTPQQADPPPVCLKTLLTWHRVHTHPPRSASSAIQRLAGGVDSWPPLWPHHTRSQTCTHTTLSLCIRCIRLLDRALLWPRWACKVQFWLPCPGLLGQGCDLESTLERCWRGRVEQSMHIVLDRVQGPMGSFDWHLSNKAITDLSDVFAHFTQLLCSQTLTHTMWITTTFSATSFSQEWW